MKRAVAALFALIWITSLAFAQETNGPATITELQQRIAEHVSQSRFDAALWGIKIVSLDSGRTLFETNAQKLFSPASNCKLYTVAMALDRFGPDYTIKTSVRATSKPNRWGTLKGDLVVLGRGDPTINARVHGHNLYAALQPFVSIVSNAGIKRIKGDLVADETFFHGPPYGSGWAWDDLEYDYGAEISPLTFNDNTVQLSVAPGASVGAPCKAALMPDAPFMLLSNLTATASPDSRPRISFFRPFDSNALFLKGSLGLGSTNFTDEVPVHQPAGMFLYYFKQALENEGVRVDGKLRVRSSFPDGRPQLTLASNELGEVSSLPMKEIAKEIMKPSQNLYTDLLLAHVGEQARDSEPIETHARRERRGPLTSEELGMRELESFLLGIGVKDGDVLFEEGSGLSRNNLTTPNATIRLLEYMHGRPTAAIYRYAMPIAGVDGTLRNRLKGTPAAGNLHAKTGTLRWAISLSGYVTSAAGENLAFSIMLNRYHSPEERGSGRTEIDAIAAMLAELRQKTGA